jgi:hypothetical protein
LAHRFSVVNNPVHGREMPHIQHLGTRGASPHYPVGTVK